MITDASVHHRDNKVNYLSTPHTSHEREYRRTNPPFGPSGVGKTCMTQFFLEELRRDVMGLNTQYLNCWEHYTRFRTLYRPLDRIDRTVGEVRKMVSGNLSVQRITYKILTCPYRLLWDDIVARTGEELSDFTPLEVTYETLSVACFVSQLCPRPSQRPTQTKSARTVDPRSLTTIQSVCVIVLTIVARQRTSVTMHVSRRISTRTTLRKGTHVNGCPVKAIVVK